MISINIPGFGELTLNYALIDFNGTLAVDGKLIEGIAKPLNALAEELEVHILTGDGMGTAKAELADIHCKLTIVPAANQGLSKQTYLHQLNSKETVAIGNGRNDGYMLKESALGIVVLGNEGASTEAIHAADVMVPSIFVALDLLHHHHRLRATLRA